jgi:membrane-associated phospholipid phosphatase
MFGADPVDVICGALMFAVAGAFLFILWKKAGEWP